MKYCLSGRQKKDYLKKADEILVEFRDYKIITDYFVDYPEATIILDIPNSENFDEIQSIVKSYSDISENFCCKIYDLSFVYWFKENNVKFYYGYSINNYYDLQGLIDLGVEYIKIDAPLTFDIPNLKHFNVKFRMVPNVAYYTYIPRENGICGQWVRPEDVKYYEDSIYVFEFENIDLRKEQTLYHVYAENKEWKGNLNILITNLNQDVDSRGLPDEIGEFRSACRQKCMENNSCHFCVTGFKFSDSLRVLKERRKNEQKENN